jgi:hypothetical protein
MSLSLSKMLDSGAQSCHPPAALPTCPGSPLSTPVADRVSLTSVWGIAGIAVLLGNTILRLTGIVGEGLSNYPIAPWQWGVLLGWVAFMGWTEGYQGFQRGYSRRVVIRSLQLSQETAILPRVLAPLVCMGLMYAPRARMIFSWILVLGIAALVASMRMVPQPWRAIIDAGVVVGLSWGLIAMLVYFAQAVRGLPVPAPVARRVS